MEKTKFAASPARIIQNLMEELDDMKCKCLDLSAEIQDAADYGSFIKTDMARPSYFECNSRLRSLHNKIAECLSWYVTVVAKSEKWGDEPLPEPGVAEQEDWILAEEEVATRVEELEHEYISILTRCKNISSNIKDKIMEDGLTLGNGDAFDPAVFNQPYGTVKFSGDDTLFQIQSISDYGDDIKIVAERLADENHDGDFHHTYQEISDAMSWYLSIVAMAFAEKRNGDTWGDKINKEEI